MSRPDLWTRAHDQSVRALTRGALSPIHTEVQTVLDRGVPFSVRAISTLRVKEERAAKAAAGGDDPFLPPYPPELLVEEVGQDHALLLNKFPVVDDHLLLVTRRFEPQASVLRLGDFEALERCLQGAEALVFYNGGRTAGASQEHKHLQLVPVPLAEAAAGEPPRATPLDPTLHAAALPFWYALAERPSSARQTHAAYLELMRQVRCDAPLRPYNLLISPRWMMVVPRRRERCDAVSINALGFAGSILLKHREQIERVRQLGPMRILGRVGHPPPGAALSGAASAVGAGVGVEVEAYAGYRGAQEPRALSVGGTRHVVAEVLSRARSPEGSAFRVRTEDGGIYELLYDEQAERWRLA